MAQSLVPPCPSDSPSLKDKHDCNIGARGPQPITYLPVTEDPGVQNEEGVCRKSTRCRQGWTSKPASRCDRGTLTAACGRHMGTDRLKQIAGQGSGVFAHRAATVPWPRESVSKASVRCFTPGHLGLGVGTGGNAASKLPIRSPLCSKEDDCQSL